MRLLMTESLLFISSSFSNFSLWASDNQKRLQIMNKNYRKKEVSSIKILLLWKCLKSLWKVHNVYTWYRTLYTMNFKVGQVLFGITFFLLICTQTIQHTKEWKNHLKMLQIYVHFIVLIPKNVKCERTDYLKKTCFCLPPSQNI